MTIQPRITDYLASTPQATGREIAEHLGLSEKTAGDSLRRLMMRGQVIVAKRQRTRSDSTYRLAKRDVPAIAKAMETLEAMQVEARRRLMNGTYLEAV